SPCAGGASCPERSGTKVTKCVKVARPVAIGIDAELYTRRARGACFGSYVKVLKTDLIVDLVCLSAGSKGRSYAAGRAVYGNGLIVRIFGVDIVLARAKKIELASRRLVGRNA